MANSYTSAEDWLNLFDNTSAEIGCISDFSNLPSVTQNPSALRNPAQPSHSGIPVSSAMLPKEQAPLTLDPRSTMGLIQQPEAKPELRGIEDRMIIMEVQLKWIYDNQQEIMKKLSSMEGVVNGIAESMGTNSWDPSAADDDMTSQTSSDYRELKSEATSDDDIEIFNLEDLEGSDLDKFLE
ncbi:High-osmolarity-induced transcription protein 1 [Purpureocillium lavendulum]|uniref:High-osmolarity-induced transcription protein 1 n=1 Tax=Purpureocillium lavendulum TaxID=1247861 RepID=A0AB34FBK7_9HYPO|nr:High-osmolarity-induced transcription protein 1 [Purpureocillium lavendulum]